MRRLLAVLILLAGCSSAPKPTPDDPALSRLGHAGDIAFKQEQPDQAAEQYRAALVRARVRDDAAAIADAGFNLATAELRAGRARDALRTAQDLQAELARRGIVDADFDLISATALFRLGEFPAADRMASALTGDKDPARADAGWFLRGLVADASGNAPGLATAVAAMSPTANMADTAELRSRLSHDRTLALQAADLRRDQLDYRGMARALALAAQFTPSGAEAADLYLRAARSAAGQGDAAQARIWLGQARDLAPDAALRADAETALHALPAP
jgi:tetratricopeptide (TPR) repeat protein